MFPLKILAHETHLKRQNIYEPTYLLSFPSINMRRGGEGNFEYILGGGYKKKCPNSELPKNNYSKFIIFITFKCNFSLKERRFSKVTLKKKLNRDEIFKKSKGNFSL